MCINERKPEMNEAKTYRIQIVKSYEMQVLVKANSCKEAEEAASVIAGDGTVVENEGYSYMKVACVGEVPDHEASDDELNLDLTEE